MPRKFIKIIKSVSVNEPEGRSITLMPSSDNNFKISSKIKFDSKIIGEQSFVFDKKNNDFIRDISKARTFGFIAHLEKLQASGLAKGASIHNTIAIDNERILNEGGMRYENEFVRHKIIDCIGDLYLIGGHLICEVSAIKSGHKMHHKVLNKLYYDKSSYITMHM